MPIPQPVVAAEYLEKEFKDFVEVVFPLATDAQKHSVRQTFYAGALVASDAVYRTTGSGKDMVAAAHKECELYAEMSKRDHDLKLKQGNIH